MNNEAPKPIWRTTNGYIYNGPSPEPCVEYRRVDPPAAPAKCVKCGHDRDDPKRRGKHPDDHGTTFCVYGCGCECVFAPAAPDERDKATVKRIFKRYLDDYINDFQFENELIAAFATVRAEVLKESAESIVNEAGKVGQLMDLASASARKEERAEVKATLLDYFKHFPCTCVRQPRTGGHFAVCPITIRGEVLGRLEGLEAARTGKVEG